MIKVTAINKILKDCKFTSEDSFLSEIFDEADANYFIIKAYEQLKTEKTAISINQLKYVIKVLMLAILKKEQTNGTKVTKQRRPRSKNTKGDSPEANTSSMVRDRDARQHVPEGSA